MPAGQSLGGHTALLAAAAHPGLLRGLVLVEAGPGRADPNLQTEIGAMLDAWLSSWAGPASCPRPRRRAMLQQRPGTVALSVPGAGHDVHLERPEVLRQVLRTFLEQVDGGRRLPPDE
ncbi:alpha/beta fold hydrolase [Streptomyces iakyrus]|uniref:Alpha/beta fold hydrolase n=1 Tax=Streptomyces iakyrus TaxID=68219 RepID=A0ABW8FLM8_9ACTN